MTLHADARRTIYAAFDATPSRWCYSIFHSNAIHLNDVRLDLVKSIAGDFQTERAIAVAETFAAVECLLDLFQSISGPAIVVLVGDNQNATRALWSLVSSNDEIKQQTSRSGLNRIDARSTSVVCVDIHTDANYADLGTRPQREISDAERLQRYQDTRNRFREALQIYKRTRKTYIHRDETSENH